MQNFTYGDLRKALESKLRTENNNTTPSTYKNLMSSLNAFLRGLGIDDEQVIGSEFGDSYYHHLNKHLEEQRTLGRSEQNLRDRKYHLKTIRALYLTLRRASATKLSPFQEAVMHCLRDLPLKPLAKQSGISISALKRWRSGVIPAQRSISTVRRLEKFLALTPGILTDLLPTAAGREQKVMNHEPIAYRKNLAKQTKERYRLTQASDAIKEEWSDFISYKNNPLPFGIKRSRSGRWTASSDAIAPSQRTELWYAISETGEYIPSASFNWGLLSSFLGWIKNISQDERYCAIETMALLTHKELIEKYLAWKIRRAGNQLNSGHASFVIFVLTLVHPETGYLTQRADLRAALPQTLSADEWRMKCNEVFNVLKEANSHIAKSSKRSRNPFEAIQSVIDLDNPLRALQDMIARMRADRPTPGTKQESVWARDLLLINLLICTPIRLGNLRSIRFKNDNSENLYLLNDNWHLKLSTAELKNRNGAAKDIPFDVELNPKLKAEIDRYLKIHRPRLLLNRPASDRVFIASKGNSQGGWRSLSRRIERLTAKYLMGCQGVGAHAVRHIVATAICKASGDFSTAALVLHDREETVRKYYAHLVPNDGHKKYRSMFPDQFS